MSMLSIILGILVLFDIILCGQAGDGNDQTTTSTTTTTEKTPPVEVQVLILGAGVAGITAAKTLTEEGITDFLIIEGSRRIGGRVTSYNFAGKTVEVGANWIILREDRNPMWRAVKKYNISGFTLDGDDVVIRNHKGHDVTDTEGEEAWEKLEVAQEKLTQINDRMEEGVLADMSIRACLNSGRWQPQTPVEKVVEIFDYDFEYGNIPDVCSCQGEGELHKEIDDLYYVSDENGYESIITKMADEFLTKNDSRLILNEFVEKINYTSSGVAVETRKGNIYKATFALMTFSHGVLKTDLVQFNPPLPDWKLDNLFRVRMESYINIFLQFPAWSTPFWDSSVYILNADKRRGFYPVFINHNSDSMIHNSSTLLQVITFGEEAERVSLLSTRDVAQEVMTLLGTLYVNHTVPAYQRVLVTRFETSALYRGAFANVEPGISPDIFKAITAPVNKLYFAGDAYSEYDGYTTGAALSGEENAKKIAQCIKGGKCEEYTPPKPPPKPNEPTCGGGGVSVRSIYIIFSIMSSMVYTIY